VFIILNPKTLRCILGLAGYRVNPCLDAARQSPLY